MASSPAAEIAVPGTAVTLHVEQGEHVDVVLRGDLEEARPGIVEAVANAIAAQQHGLPSVPVRVLAYHPPDRVLPLPTAVADRLGLRQVRDLFQMRRPLPVGPDDPARTGAPPLALRPFSPERDAEAWVRANNRAFATHPDQGRQTAETLEATLAEDWVDLDGFLVVDDADRPGELAGSCWTRVHPATADDPALGEIFVIGVDPAHHGRHLGQSLVLAGLDHLAWSGTTTAMLYVEADNDPALRLYDRLGFAVHLRYRICSR